ncbi:hypothetical protein L1887_59518 [Cichorium endivia]|nr:hypothetical protein L1887_59518 [Cichorium endivia]
MQIATACVLHRAMSFRQSEQYSRNVALFLISSLSIETIYHSIMDEQMVHELTFLLLILLVIRQTRSLIRDRIQKDEEKRMLKWLSIFGAAYRLETRARNALGFLAGVPWLVARSDGCRRLRVHEDGRRSDSG